MEPAPITPSRASASPAAAVGRRRWRLMVGLSVVLSAGVYLLLPAEMGELGRRAVAIAVFAAAMWATEAIPLFVTSLGVIGLEVLLLASRDGGGGLAGTGDLSYRQFFEPFASSTIILFLGGFLLAAAVTKHRLDRAVAGRLLRPFVGDSYKMVFATIFTTGFLSIWMSNTAVAAMMLAVIGPLIREPVFPRRLASALVLAVAFGASLGGFITPVSTPPNAITISQLRAIGVEITFLQWVLMAAPLSVCMLLAAGVLLCVILRPPRRFEPGPVADAWEASRGEPVSRAGWATVVVIVGAAAAWMTRPWHGVADAAVAIMAATLLAAVGVLDRRDVRSIDWDVLLLMWGGLALGNGLHVTGVLDYVGTLPAVQQLTGWALALMVIGGGMIVATFMSNTTAANILVPLAIALSMGGAGTAADGGAGPEAVHDAARMGVLAGLTVSFSVSMPISTPPNAMAYATGMVSARDIIRVGLLVSVLAVGALMSGYLWVLPWVGAMR